MIHRDERRVRADQVLSFVLEEPGSSLPGEVGSLIVEMEVLFRQCVFGDLPPEEKS